MSHSVPPPAYPAALPKKQQYGAVPTSAQADSASEPLLAAHGQQQWASGSNAPRNDWDEEGGDGDVPEDFKIGVTVAQSSQDVRNAFVRKVYGVLFVQILATTIVGWIMSADEISNWVHQHSGLMLIPCFGAIGAMLGVYWKRHSHPLNLVLLGVFTLLEAVTLGSIVSYYSQTVVLQALVITSFVFIGLTLFTLQSKIDFSGMGSYLFAALLVFFMTGVVGIFLPYSRTMDMVIAGGGCLLFSAYIVYDTHLLLNRLHVDDWILACVSLYLDIVNLFLQILRLLSSAQDR